MTAAPQPTNWYAQPLSSPMQEKPSQLSIRGLLIATTIASLFFVAFHALRMDPLVIALCLGVGGVLVAGAASGALERDWPKHTIWIGAGLMGLGIIMAVFAVATA